MLHDGREANGSSGHGPFVREAIGKYPVDPYMDDVEIVPDVHVAKACRQAERKLAEAVVAARAASVSWADIGRAAVMTRPGAHERWDKAAKLELSRPQETSD